MFFKYMILHKRPWLWCSAAAAMLLCGCTSVPSSPPLRVENQPSVVLIHALGRRPGSLKTLGRYLSEAGYTVHSVSYPSLRKNIQQASQHISAQIEACCSNQKLNFVTHSLGGIVLRQYAKDVGIENIHRVVMLAPPNQGSEVVDRWFFQPLLWVAGPSARQLGTKEEDKPKDLGSIEFVLGVIAGNKTRNPLFSISIPGPDDGAVAVQSTKHEDMQDFVLLPLSHPRLPKKAVTALCVGTFLSSGSFDGCFSEAP